jgi:putative ABC transport system permease protein
MHWWKSLFRKQAIDEQLDSELRFHIEHLVDENIAAGMAPQEARRQAMLEFGGHEQVKEDVRDVHRVSVIESTMANLKFAMRLIRKSPSFSIAVILTLALGIGANSAVFSAIDAIILRPLPFPNSDQLMRIDQYDTKGKSPQTFVAPVRLEDWNRTNSTFQAITGYYTEDASETSGALPEKVSQAWVAPRFLQVWGVSPALGRDFDSEEETFGGPSAVIISDRLWRQRFNADQNVVGKKLQLGSYSAGIVGVMPASFLFPQRGVDLWSPIPTNSPFSGDRSSTWYTVIGRLKPGVNVEQARVNLATIQAQLGRAFPKTDADLGIKIQPLKQTTIGGAQDSLWILFGSVSLLLLIACTNIAALLLARGAERQHEITVRFLLGASRTALVIQLLTEIFVLALVGAAVGLVLAGGTASVFRALAADLPRVEEIHIDWRIVLYSFACCIFVTLLCGLFPAIRATRNNISGSLAQGSRTQVSGRHPLQWVLVAVQVALAVTLLAGAGLLFRSFQALGRVSPGFEAAHVLTLHISASYGETADMKGLVQRIDQTIDTLRSLPGVEAAATAAALPGVPSQYQTEIKVAEGQSDPERKIVAESRFVSAGYFATMQIPLLTGELCREKSGSADVLVNRSFATAYLSRSTAIGHHLQLPGNSFVAPGEIRGIVGDAREEGMNREPGPTVYWCMSAPVPDPFYLIRTRSDPMTMAQSARLKIHDLDPSRSVFDILPLEDHLNEAFAENRLRTVLLTFFALTAVCLACVGLYGTLSYFVSTRKREVGLRLALGAMPGRIVKHFLLRGLGVSAAGCAVGSSLAVAFGRVLSKMLYGISPTDVTTFLGVVLTVMTVATIASLVPAIRAARVDPMEVLREE